MGAQLHLKAFGIFGCLNIRASKPGYLKDIPRTLDYAREVASRYADLRPLSEFIETRVIPEMPS